MSLTAEQQAEVDKQNAIEDNRAANIDAQEATRAANIEVQEARKTKLEAMRMAKELLVENARSKPVDERGITTDEVIAFATILVAYANS